jgi:DNA-binding transcriptional LysR family regulator
MSWASRCSAASTARLELTAAGTRYLEAVGDALDLIERASAALRPPRRQTTLRLSVLQSFATLWLLPRLAAFKQARPDLDVEIETSTELIDLSDGRRDAAIRFGTGHWPGLAAERLFHTRPFPSPRLACCAPAGRSRPAALEPHGAARHRPGGRTCGRSISWVSGSRLPAEEATHLRQRPGDARGRRHGLGLALATAEMVGGQLAAGRLIKPFSNDPGRAAPELLPGLSARASRSTGAARPARGAARAAARFACADDHSTEPTRRLKQGALLPYGPSNHQETHARLDSRLARPRRRVRDLRPPPISKPTSSSIATSSRTSSTGAQPQAADRYVAADLIEHNPNLKQRGRKQFLPPCWPDSATIAARSRRSSPRATRWWCAPVDRHAGRLVPRPAGERCQGPVHDRRLSSVENGKLAEPGTSSTACRAPWRWASSRRRRRAEVLPSSVCGGR